MKSTLIISGHPRLSQSTANRLIIENIINTPGVATCDIMTNYPDGKINVEEEQSRLKAADLIVFQFPFIWYGMPSHMKAWMEKVFSYGFAFGTGGDQLKNKKLLLSITLGGSSEAYSAQGQHLYTVETFLRPLELFVKYCGMQYLLPVYSYEMASSLGVNQQIVEDKARLHAQRVFRVIKSQNPKNALSPIKQAV